MDSPTTIRLGARARQRITAEGLQAADVAIIPAAAGGPKGLILHGIDNWLFGEWLPSAPRQRKLIEASIGSWRMAHGALRIAAAAFHDPVAAHKRLAYHYSHQTYPDKVDAAYLTRACITLLDEVLDGRAAEPLSNPHYQLSVITVRGIGALGRTRGSRWREMAGFLLAAGGNAVSRGRLASSLERVVFHDARDDMAWLRGSFDSFASHFVGLTESNMRDALLESGSIP